VQVCDGVSSPSDADPITHVGGDLRGLEESLFQPYGLRFRISPGAFFQTNTRACEVLYKTVLGLALGSPESGPPSGSPSGSPSGPPSARLGSGGGRSPALLPRTETAPPETPAELVARLDASVAEFYATEDTAGEANWPRRPR